MMKERSGKSVGSAKAGFAHLVAFTAIVVLTACIAWTGNALASDATVWPARPPDKAASVEPVGARPDASDFARRVRNAYWRDRTCDTPHCRAQRPSNLIDVASFGLAAVGGIFFARRKVL